MFGAHNVFDGSQSLVASATCSAQHHALPRPISKVHHKMVAASGCWCLHFHRVPPKGACHLIQCLNLHCLSHHSVVGFAICHSSLACNHGILCSTSSSLARQARIAMRCLCIGGVDRSCDLGEPDRQDHCLMATLRVAADCEVQGDVCIRGSLQECACIQVGQRKNRVPGGEKKRRGYSRAAVLHTTRVA